MATTITRPGTPFPTTESDSYFNMPSTTTASRHYPQPIHFQLPTRAILTPPSLLKRASSSGSSSSSSYHLSRTPSASTSTPTLSRSRSRRESQCSSCGSGSSPVMPTTPILEDVFGEDQDEVMISTGEFELPEPLYTPTKPKSQTQTPSYLPTSTNEANKTFSFSVKKFKPTLETIKQQEPQTPTPTTPMTLMLPPPTFTRPTLKRRDTPRPQPQSGFPTMSPFWDQPILSPIEENRPKRKLTSLVDGLSWIVVE